MLRGAGAMRSAAMTGSAAMDSPVVVRAAQALPVARNRPDGVVDGMVFDALRVFEARRGAFGEPTVARLAHWCGIGVRQAKDTVRRLRERGLVEAVGRVPGRTGTAQTYRAVVEVAGG